MESSGLFLVTSISGSAWRVKNGNLLKLGAERRRLTEEMGANDAWRRWVPFLSDRSGPRFGKTTRRTGMREVFPS